MSNNNVVVNTAKLQHVNTSQQEQLRLGQYVTRLALEVIAPIRAIATDNDMFTVRGRLGLGSVKLGLPWTVKDLEVDRTSVMFRQDNNILNVNLLKYNLSAVSCHCTQQTHLTVRPKVISDFVIQLENQARYARLLF